MKVLIVEDEKELATILASYLEVEGFTAVTAEDGQLGLAVFERESPDLVLLDIMLPKKSGIELCKEIRAVSDIPVIMISAKSGEMDKVVALGIGADDYVTKPFSPLELVARVKAQWRRYQGVSGKRITQENGEISIGPLSVDKMAYQVKVNEEIITMTTKEFEILYYFVQNAGQVLSKIQIYQAAWGYEGIPDDNAVTVYINRIRDKLLKSHLDCIKTVWGVGYKLIL